MRGGFVWKKLAGALLLFNWSLVDFISHFDVSVESWYSVLGVCFDRDDKVRFGSLRRSFWRKHLGSRDIDLRCKEVGWAECHVTRLERIGPFVFLLDGFRRYDSVLGLARLQGECVLLSLWVLKDGRKCAIKGVLTRSVNCSPNMDTRYRDIVTWWDTLKFNIVWVFKDPKRIVKVTPYFMTFEYIICKKVPEFEGYYTTWHGT